MIKAAFFDIDGTLLSFKTHCVSEGTIRAFETLHKKGIRTFIASGRPLMLFPEFPVTFDGYVTMNGGYVIVGDKVLIRQPIPQDETDTWLRYAIENNICSMCFSEHEMGTGNVNETGLKIREQLEFPLPPISPIESMIGKEVFQIIGVMPASCDEQVQAMLPNCSLPRWHPEFTDIVNKANNKAVGIDAICRHIGIKPEETIAFGDGGNDIEMLEFCGIGVAMGNASDTVKGHADYVTSTVDKEGIEQAIIKFIGQ